MSLLAAATATGSVVMPSGLTPDTMAVLTAAQTFLNKTISGAVNTITNVSLTAGVTGVLPLANLPTGLTLQSAYSAYATCTSLSTTIPYDDTIPQNTEGTLILTAALVVKSATNRVRVRFQGPAGLNGGAGDSICIALFRNSTANALAANFFRLPDGNGTYATALEFEDVPGAATTQTYNIRVGANVQAVSMNGPAATRRGGGTSVCTLVLEEISA
jgi:hypothetical protein